MARLINWLRQRGWASPRTVLFYRDFRGFTGGHLKVWHYFNHIQYAQGYQAQIAFSADSIWDETNPWHLMRSQILTNWNSEQAAILFIAGMDWSILSAAQRALPPKPIINLIQHVRHADSQLPLYQYLQHPAIRICVSAEVADALTATKIVNGPIFTIPNGIDDQDLPISPSWAKRKIDILIVGIKQPAFATELHQRLNSQNLAIETIINAIPRANFLTLLANSKIAVFLPHATEGFYLPALEGFKLNSLVICPDCIGNRQFCLPEKNCLQPNYEIEAFVQQIQRALNLSESEKTTLLLNGQTIAQQYSLLKERQAFLKILADVDKLWSSNNL